LASGGISGASTLPSFKRDAEPRERALPHQRPRRRSVSTAKSTCPPTTALSAGRSPGRAHARYRP
jgi:hypothetical protein